MKPWPALLVLPIVGCSFVFGLIGVEYQCSTCPAEWRVVCKPRPRDWRAYNLEEARHVHRRFTEEFGRECRIYHRGHLIDPKTGKAVEVK